MFACEEGSDAKMADLANLQAKYKRGVVVVVVVVVAKHEHGLVQAMRKLRFCGEAERYPRVVVVAVVAKHEHGLVQAMGKFRFCGEAERDPHDLEVRGGGNRTSKKRRSTCDIDIKPGWRAWGHPPSVS